MPRLNGVELHKLTYRDEITASKLPSQLVCSARVKATEAVASVVARRKKGETVSCPQSKANSIRYDVNSATVKLRDGTCTLATLRKRQKFTFKVPSYAKDRVDLKVCSSDLVEHKNGHLYLHIVLLHPEPQVVITGRVEGVDLGIVRPAVTSVPMFLGLRLWREIQNRYFRLRRSLTAKGTRSAKRHLQRLSGRENRFRKDCDHVLTKLLAHSVPAGTTLVLEDLTDIRSRVQGRKRERRRLHSWSFAQFQVFLAYKCALLGIKVVYADPRYTSQKCSNCGHTAKGNRKSQGAFACLSCHFTLNADLNAARNLRNNYLAARGTSPRSGLPVSEPIVSSTTSEPMSPSDLDTSGYRSDASLAL
jgi:IS605 OrfB family transposase